MNENQEIIDILKYSVSEITGSVALRNKIEYLYACTNKLSICGKRAGNVRTAFRDFRLFLASGKTLNLKRQEETKEKIKSIMAVNSDSKFAFKDGSVVFIREPFFEHFSNKNLTDEKAIAILKANPKSRAHFLKLPENWMDLVKGIKSPELVFVATHKPETISENGHDENHEDDSDVAVETKTKKVKEKKK